MIRLIEIIAISHFGALDLERLVHSLRRQTYESWRLLVVDNSMDSAEAVRIAEIVNQDHRIVKVDVRNNLGYFGGARAGLEMINPDASTIAIVSNVDLELSDSTVLEKIVAAAEEADSDLGLIAPAIVSNRTGLDQNPHLVRRPSLLEQRRRRRRMSSIYTAQLTLLASAAWHGLKMRRRNAVPTADMDIYAAHGAFMIFLPAYFERGGNFDHPLFLFAEELTVAEQCRANHLRTRYVAGIRVQHVEHGQMGFFRSRRVLREMVSAADYGYRLLREGS